MWSGAAPVQININSFSAAVHEKGYKVQFLRCTNFPKICIFQSQKKRAESERDRERKRDIVIQEAFSTLEKKEDIYSASER